MENQTQTDELIVQEVDSEIVYQQDKAQVDVQIATAKQYPRNIKRAVDNSIAVVTMDVKTAQTSNYSLPRGGKTISGPSVHLAKILAQNWSNMRVEAKVVEIGQKRLTSQAVAFDLENNLAIKVEVKRSIMTKRGRMNDDMITVTGNAANAIALRNAILAVIPKAVVDKVYNSAKQMITGDVSDKTKLLKKRKMVFDTFKDDYGVSEKDVLKVIGKASVTNITQEDLVTLIGLGQAIKDGDTTIEETFYAEPQKKSTEEVKKDNQKEEDQRVLKFIEEAETIDDLELLQDLAQSAELKKAYDKKHQQLSK